MQTFEEIKTYILQHATEFVFKLIFALLIIIIGWKIVKWLLKLLDKGKLFSKADNTVRAFIKSVIGIVLKGLLIASAAIVLGVPESSFLALFTSCGVAIGLALQGSLSNFAGGLLLLFFKPFKEGDYIKTNENEGSVVSVNVFYTVVRTLENQLVTLPNGTLANTAITNYTAEKTRRMDISFDVAYGSDIDKVREVVSQIADECKTILKEPKPIVVLAKQDESSFVFILQFWIKPTDYWETKYYVNEKIAQKFVENNIEIPFPQLDIHVK